MTTTTMTSTAKRPVPTRAESTYQAELSGEPDPVRHRQMIPEAAYYKAQERGFDLGHEVVDWLGAEQDLQSRQGRE
jgi:hypothetical protein